MLNKSKCRIPAVAQDRRTSRPIGQRTEASPTSRPQCLGARTKIDSCGAAGIPHKASIKERENATSYRG